MTAAAARPTPEGAFIAWLLGLPENVDQGTAARLLIAEIDRHAPLSTDLQRLRGYVAVVAAGRSVC